MNTDHFRQPKEKPAQKEKTPAKEKEDGKKEKKGKKRTFEKGGKKLPAVPESVLKSRKRRDIAKAARVNVALKVISVIYSIMCSSCPKFIPGKIVG
jgi:hypothetical protein